LETPEDVDEVISTEVPDPAKKPYLYRLVTEQMTHAKCSERCFGRNGKCSKNYPMQFQERTVMQDAKGWVSLKRPAGGRTFTKGVGRNKATYDTRDVVPYNPYLLSVLGCHVNVLPFTQMQQVYTLNFDFFFTAGCNRLTNNITFTLLLIHNFVQVAYVVKYIVKGLDMATIDMTYNLFGHEVRVSLEN